MNESIKNILQQVSQRINEIQPIYKKLVLRLKLSDTELQDDETIFLLDLARQFLNNELSADAFIKCWQSFEANTSQFQQLPNYRILRDRLQHGELIPLLGHNVQTLSNPPLTTIPDLTQCLAQQAKYHDFKGSLALISHYYQMTEYGRGKLCRTVRDMIEPKTLVQYNPLYELLSECPEPLIIISMCYDTHLERQFHENGKSLAVLSHFRQGMNLSDKLFLQKDQALPKVIMAEDLSQFRLLENGYSLLYNIYGSFKSFREGADSKFSKSSRFSQKRIELEEQWYLISNKLSKLEKNRLIQNDPAEQFKLENQISEAKSEQNRIEDELDIIEEKEPSLKDKSLSQCLEEDLVFISEDDHFLFVKHLERIIPDYVANRLLHKGILCLGHDLEEWHHRLLLDALLSKKRGHQPSFAVKENPTLYECAFWKSHGVDLYQINIQTFVEKLKEI